MGQHALLYCPAIRKQSDTIPSAKRNLRKAQGRIDREVELAQSRNARPHQPACINYQPDGLAALDLVHARDQLSAPCRCGPAYVAHFVPFPIFAQALKLAPSASYA